MTATKTETRNPIKQTFDYGQSIWYDGLISKATFEKMIAEDGIRGATTNPAIFEKELVESTPTPKAAPALVATCAQPLLLRSCHSCSVPFSLVDSN